MYGGIISSHYFGYKDKVCVVTGAASGIGRSTVDLLLDMGAVVYAIDIKDIEIEFKYCGTFASTPDNLGFIGSDKKHNNLW